MREPKDADGADNSLGGQGRTKMRRTNSGARTRSYSHPSTAPKSIEIQSSTSDQRVLQPFKRNQAYSQIAIALSSYVATDRLPSVFAPTLLLHGHSYFCIQLNACIHIQGSPQFLEETCVSAVVRVEVLSLDTDLARSGFHRSAMCPFAWHRDPEMAGARRLRHEQLC